MRAAHGADPVVHDHGTLPPDLPVPIDDGGATHLTGMRLPDVALASTDGRVVSLARLPGRSIVFTYPRTGQPGEPNLSPDWDAIPGARGCTPQACGFRDAHTELIARGVARIYGLSTQTSAYQHEAATRLHLPYALLSDRHRAFALAARLPTFEVGSEVLLRRLTMVVDDGVVGRVFYPVFPPDRAATQVMAWLDAGG